MNNAKKKFSTENVKKKNDKFKFVNYSFVYPIIVLARTFFFEDFIAKFVTS